MPDVSSGVPAKFLVVLGNAGSSIWYHFMSSPEYRDGADDPLNRWSERIGHALAEQWHGKALFPFGKPPYHPFIRWAQKAEGLRQSALGLLMHPDYGLWHAYRFAIGLSVDLVGLPTSQRQRHACDHCRNRPCLTTCPVRAFDGVSYDVEACYRYLEAHPDSPCRATCQARAACPEGVDYQYEPAHAAFHMEKFYQSLSVRFDES